MSALRPQQSIRLRLITGLPVRLGRIDGLLVDVGRGGARVRHAGPVKVGTEMQFTFMSNGQKFTSTARVVSCRVVALGSGDKGATQYESSVRYTKVEAESMAIVEAMLGSAFTNENPR